MQLLNACLKDMKIFSNTLYDIEFPRNMTSDVWESVI